MTDSIFDPNGPLTEHSGTRNLGPQADNDSHMPPEVVDGVAVNDPDAPDEDAETEEIAAAEDEVRRDKDPDKSA